MKYQLWVVFLSQVCFVFANRNNVCMSDLAYSFKIFGCWYDSDLESNTSAIVARHGYPIEEYNVTTNDGYILRVYRIPHNGKNANAKRKPVLLQHGMLQNSIIWVDIGIRSLAFVLSNLGYDVWMGNTRGTTYSNKHVKFNLADKKFWDYTLDSLGHYDTPAVVKLIREKTHQKVIYIGHSQGTTQSYIYCIDNRTHCENYVKGLISLAPVAFLNGLPILKYVTPLLEPILRLLHKFDVNSVGFDQDTNRKLLTLFCLQSLLQIKMCRFVAQVLYGKDAGIQWSSDLIPAMFKNLVDRESILPVIQYAQLANSKKFESFNYGKERNLQLYGQEGPKEYDLSKIDLPVYLLYGVNDILASPQNVIRLYEKLQCPKKLIKIGDKFKFNHNHFVYSNRLGEELYSKLLPIIEEIGKL